MRTPLIVWDAVVSLFFGYCGWLLTFRTSTIVRRAHSTYGFSFFLKPWYSAFMRCIGIFFWLCAVLIDYLLVTQRWH
jgi:hypothetical protein